MRLILAFAAGWLASNAIWLWWQTDAGSRRDSAVAQWAERPVMFALGKVAGSNPARGANRREPVSDVYLSDLADILRREARSPLRSTARYPVHVRRVALSRAT